MIERDVKKLVRNLLTEFGWFHWMPPSNAYGKAGIADINAVRDGRFLAIETKVGRNLPTPQQRIFLAQVAAAGGYAFMVNEARLPALRLWLDESIDPAVRQGVEQSLAYIPPPPKALR